MQALDCDGTVIAVILRVNRNAVCQNSPVDGEDNGRNRTRVSQ